MTGRDGIFLFIVFVIAASIYLIPAIVAIRSNHPNKTAIVVLNILAGWTFIVWVVALVWALTKPVGSSFYQGGQPQQPANINGIQQAQMQAANQAPQTPYMPSNGRQVAAYSKGVPKLVGVSGLFTGRVVDLTQGKVVIGRDPHGSHLAYPSSNSRISRIHCIVRYEENSRRFILEDSSTNGTYIYPQARLTSGQPVYVEAGTRFYLGDPSEQYELRIE
jgi:hypothetical protein